jgi:transcriptional antiterminator NusG
VAKQWFILSVGPNREEKVKRHLWTRAQAQDITHLISEPRVVTERVTEIKGGQRRSVERKVYAGYIMVEIATNEDGSIPAEVWHLIRETPGPINFVGSQDKPQPMQPHEVQRMNQQIERLREEPEKLTVDFEKGEHVRVKEGSFENFEGTIEEVNPEKGSVKVTIMVFGRPTPIDFEYWKVENTE